MHASTLQFSTLIRKKQETITMNSCLREAINIVNTSFQHEICNALTPILFIANLLQSRSGDPEVISSMELIQSSALKIKQIIHQISELGNQEKIQTTEYLHEVLMLDLGKQDLN